MLTKTTRKHLNLSILLIRFALGGILFGVGCGKVLGWFGGAGLQPTLKFFVAQMHIPIFFAYLSIFTEFIGGLLLILGLLARPAAFAIAINMIVATIFTLPMKVFAAYPFSLVISAVVILLTGPMDYSIDALWTGDQT